MMGYAVFILLVFLCWAVVLPIWSLISRARARQRLGIAQERLAERERAQKAFSRVIFGLEWTGRWRVEAPAPAMSRVDRPAPAQHQVFEAPAPAPVQPGPPPLPAAAMPSQPAPAPPAHHFVQPAAGTASPLQAIPAPAVEAAPAAPPPPAPRPQRGSPAEVRAAVARYSAWREHVRPFLIENIGWFIGGFLIVAGSLYFLREAWGSFAQLGRHLLVVTTALAYAGGFVGVALWLKRAHALGTASRAMAYVGLALLPVAALAASGTFDLRPLAWVAVAPVVLGVAYPLLYLAAGLLDRPLAGPLARGLAAMLALILVSPAAGALSPQAALVLPYLGWAVLHFASTAPLRGTSAPSAGVLGFHLSALAYSLLFVLGRAHGLGGAALPFPAFYGPLAVLASFTALRVDVELRARWGSRPEIDAAVVASFAAALAGIALAAREPSYLALSAALAAAHFAAGIAWYRRPLLLYFSLASAAGALLGLLGSPAARSVLDALSLLSRGRPAPQADSLCAAALALLVISAAASWLEARFAARGEERLARAGNRAAWLFLAGSGGLALSTAAAGLRLGPAICLAAAAALVALWHRRAPRESTAWAGAASFACATGLAAIRFDGPLGGVAWASIVLALAAAPALFREGRRSGSAALLHFALLAAALSLGTAGLRTRELIFFTAVFAGAAVALGNALVGVAASGAGLALLALAIGGPGALQAIPGAELRWALLPAAALALTFALQRAGRVLPGLAPLPTLLPFPERGLRALSVPLLACAGLATILLAVRGMFSIDPSGAQLLGASAAFALALAALSAAPAWSAAAAGLAAAAGAWEAGALLGVTLPALALGAAIASFAALAAARAARARLAAHALASIDLSIVALSLVTAIAIGCAAVAPPIWAPQSLCFAALAVSAAALCGLAAPVRPASAWAGLIALGAAAAALPLAAGRPPTLVAPALAALALLLLWVRHFARSAPAWTAPLLGAGPHLIAAAALAFNLGPQAPFLDWNRAICDGLLTAYLASALYVQGGVIFVHLLLALAGLGVVRARTLLGIEPSGWGTVVAAAALLGLAAALRRREKYANALLIWAALAITYTCEWCLGAPRLRWTRMAAAALVAIPLAPRFFPLITSGVAVVALSAALLVALPPELWVASMWPLGPAALGLALALAAEPLERVESELFCAPAQLRLALRAAAALLSTAAAGMTAWAVLAAALRLPGLDAAGPGWLAAVPLLLGGAALALVFRRLEGAPSPAWPLTMGIALAITAAALPAASAWIPGGGALLLLAEAGAVAALSGWFEDLRWAALALWAASLIATHLAPYEWTTAATVLASVWFLRGLALPADLSAPTFGLLAAAGFALAFGGTRLPFFRASGVAAPLGLLAGAAMLWHERRRSTVNASALGIASAACLVLGAVGGSPQARAAYILGGGAMLLLLCAARARSDARWIYLAAAPAIATYAWARSALDILPGLPAADATVALGSAFALALAQAALRGSPVSTPLAHLSALLPLALFFTTPPGMTPIFAGGAAALYGLLAWLRQSRAAAYVAVALVNLALFASWQARGLDDAQLYGVPLGLSLLVAAQISHGDLSRQQLSWVRGLGCLVLYAGTALQMLRFEGPTYPLILGGLALVTVVAGVGLQIRAFALLGAATLVADVLANLVRASANSSRVMAVSATLTGFLILGTMIWLSVKREETLALYRRLVSAMDDWE